MNNKELLQDKVSEFFNGDQSKIKLWWSTPNPMLGNMQPRTMSEKQCQYAYHVLDTGE